MGKNVPYVLRLDPENQQDMSLVLDLLNRGYNIRRVVSENLTEKMQETPAATRQVAQQMAQAAVQQLHETSIAQINAEKSKRVTYVNGMSALDLFRSIVNNIPEYENIPITWLKATFRETKDRQTGRAFSENTFDSIMSKLNIAGIRVDGVNNTCRFHRDELRKLNQYDFNKLVRNPGSRPRPSKAA